MNKVLFLLIIVTFIFSGLQSQSSTGIMGNTVNRSTMVTIQRNTDFQTALKILESISLQEERRNIINFSSFVGGIPVQINNIFWRDALELIVQTTGLSLEARPGVYVISDIIEEIPTIVSEYNIDDRMIRIHATFFYADRTFMNSMGINWSTLLDGEVSAQIDFHSADALGGEMLSVFGNRRLADGSVIVDMEVLFRFLEANQKGSMLARPTIVVLNGRQGNIQIGQDFSVRTLDEAGNAIQQFFSTGIILTVRPTIIESDGLEAIYLEAVVEKSDAIPGATIIINRNQTTTDVLLFDGEETVIGGLFDVEYLTDTGGIPFLRRIPLLGRLFSWSNVRHINREMIVILKAEIVPPARDRLSDRETLRESFQRMRTDFDDVYEEVFGN